MNTKPVTSKLKSVWSTAASVLFDFDGVLADSEPLFRKSWNIALEPWGHSISKQDYWKYWSSLGEGLDGEIIRYDLKGIDIPRARKKQKETYEGFVNDGLVPLFPQTSRLLEMLSSKEISFKRPYCIASNTPFNLVRKILIAGGAPVPFIVGGDRLEKKPSPDIFLRASSLLGCNPSSTLVFEDSWKGITAAETGGFMGVLVLNHYNRNLDIKSKFVIDGLEQLLDIIAGGS